MQAKALWAKLYPDRADDFECSDNFLRNFFRAHNIVPRRATTSAPKLSQEPETMRSIFLSRVAYTVQKKHVPRLLVFLCDETGMLLMPHQPTTLDFMGAKNVPVAFSRAWFFFQLPFLTIFSEDKRQITAMIAVSLDGGMLPVQLIFEGKNKARVCPDNSRYAATITTTCTENHWANVASTLEFVQLVETRRDALVDAGKVPPHSPALIVWDVFYAHRDQSVLDYCRSKNIFVVFVPANCTGFLQVCDVSVNKPWKAALAQSFEATVVKTIVENPEHTA